MTTIGSLFSGYGGLDQGVAAALGGAEVRWVSDVVERDKKGRLVGNAPAILAHRYPGVPNLGDITTVDWTRVEPVDVIGGGSPCPDLSTAGLHAGMRPGTRSGLWTSMADAIATIRPSLVVWENVRGALSAEAHSDMESRPGLLGDGAGGPALRALGRVLGDLADLGYDARWCGLRAADVGAPHGRYRVFVVARPANSGGEAGLVRTGLRASIAGGVRRGRPDHDRLPDALAYPDGVEPERVGGPRLVGGAPGPEPGEGDQRQRPGHTPGNRSAAPAWGIYEPAIRRWEALTRPAPAPTEPTGRGGKQRLSPRFVEWMMGLPAGWVTDVPGLTRNQQLRALGNGVVPQQACAAVTWLLRPRELQVAA
jgi:DNA (cytosine-5)-methyltransferase 1